MCLACKLDIHTYISVNVIQPACNCYMDECKSTNFNKTQNEVHCKKKKIDILVYGYKERKRVKKKREEEGSNERHDHEL